MRPSSTPGHCNNARAFSEPSRPIVYPRTESGTEKIPLTEPQSNVLQGPIYQCITKEGKALDTYQASKTHASSRSPSTDAHILAISKPPGLHYHVSRCKRSTRGSSGGSPASTAPPPRTPDCTLKLSAMAAAAVNRASKGVSAVVAAEGIQHALAAYMFAEAAHPAGVRPGARHGRRGRGTRRIHPQDRVPVEPPLHLRQSVGKDTPEGEPAGLFGHIVRCHSLVSKLEYSWF
ncbi:hypothetical protein DFH27DRAFT_656751 [Peziza echinospora]|nr:hypothetical protein DFH27DRAFT_656751 [Peziza echinospora]